MTGHGDGGSETSRGCVGPSEGGRGVPGAALHCSRRPRLNGHTELRLCLGGRKAISSRKEILSELILCTAPLSRTWKFSCLFLLSCFHSVMKPVN